MFYAHFIMWDGGDWRSHVLPLENVLALEPEQRKCHETHTQFSAYFTEQLHIGDGDKMLNLSSLCH